MSEPGAPVNPVSTLDPAELAPGRSAARGPAPAELDPRLHVGAESLQRFMAGALPAAEMRQVLRHLLRGCASCQESAREVWNLCGAQLGFGSHLAPMPPMPPMAAMPATAQMAAPAQMAPIALPANASLPATTPPAQRHHGPAPAPAKTLAPAHAAAPPPRHAETLQTLQPFQPSETPAPAAPVSEALQSPPSPSSQSAPSAASADDSGYDAVLDRVFSRISREEAAVEAARRRAASLLAELMQHPPAHQELLVHNSARFRDRMLCENLLAASHEEGFREPSRSLQLARLAIGVAERLAAAGAEPAAAEPTLLAGSASTELELLAGLRARAWAQVGNALRIGSDHGAAMAAFQTAEALLAANPRVGLVDKARVLDLKASLCRDRREFSEAERLLDRVIAIHRRLGQSNLMGRAIAQKATVLHQAGDLEGCLVLLHQALDLADPHDDPRWHLAVRHNLISALVNDGRPREAFALLFHTRPLYLKMGDRMQLLRLRWLEGQVAQGLHRLEQAEAAFREVRDAFVELGIAYDAALVSLDLAAVYAEQGRTPEMRRLAEEMVVFFESRQIHREAMAAVLLFCNAAAAERAGLGLVQEIAAFLKQARNTPDLRLSPRVPC
jgi:tetratricopeptide (TPR) repeat protein